MAVLKTIKEQIRRTNQSIKILVVDDFEVVRRGIISFLNTIEEFEVVGETGSGDEALTLIERHPPDVVLMDLVLPKMDGIETTRRIKSQYPDIQVIILSSYCSDAYITDAFNAGATSYQLKDIPMQKLEETVFLAAAKKTSMHPRIAERMVGMISNNHSENGAGLSSVLTERESQVLRLLGEGYSNQQIAAELFISEGTAKVHVSNILSKLDLHDRTQAAVYAWKKGLIRPSVVTTEGMIEF